MKLILAYETGMSKIIIPANPIPIFAYVFMNQNKTIIDNFLIEFCQFCNAVH